MLSKALLVSTVLIQISSANGRICKQVWMKKKVSIRWPYSLHSKIKQRKYSSVERYALTLHTVEQFSYDWYLLECWLPCFYADAYCGILEYIWYTSIIACHQYTILLLTCKHAWSSLLYHQYSTGHPPLSRFNAQLFNLLLKPAFAWSKQPAGCAEHGWDLYFIWHGKWIDTY